MDIQTNHKVKILNAKLDLVNKLYTACKKAEYGDFNTDCCSKESYLKTKLIDRLDDYCFPEVLAMGSNSTFLSDALGEALWGRWFNVLSTDDFIEIVVNDITYIIYGDGVTYSRDLVIAKLTDLGVYVSYSFTQDLALNTYITFVLTCEVITFGFTIYIFGGKNFVPYEYLFTNTVVGVCETAYTTCYNCNDASLPKLYEVMNKL